MDKLVRVLCNFGVVVSNPNCPFMFFCLQPEPPFYVLLAVRIGDNNSKVAQHVNQFVHSIDFDQATIVDRARNFHERLFLEAWYLQRDSNAGNEHIDISDVYKSLA